MLQRLLCAQRENWVEKNHDLGMNYCNFTNGLPYWDEKEYYCVSSDLGDRLEYATIELHSMCMDFVATEIKKGDYQDYNFSDETKWLIERSWNIGHQHVYGRFDFGVDRVGNIKMFEYNADTPTALLEASIIQWHWKEEVFPDDDQFNSIHEKLVARWNEYRNLYGMHLIHFTTNKEASYVDWASLHYMLETASESGAILSSIDIEEIGWDSNLNRFVDLNQNPITHLFKLYPWEWLIEDEFAKNIKISNTIFIEPIWKMLLSNKLLCVKLWEKYRDHPLLLESYYNEANCNMPNKFWINKPLLGREGQGITFGPSTSAKSICQKKFDSISFQGIMPVIGSWVIGDISAGIGIREDVGITTNNSKFVPHVFRS